MSLDPCGMLAFCICNSVQETQVGLAPIIIVTQDTT